MTNVCRQLNLIWNGLCVYVAEALHSGKGINIKGFGALTFEAITTETNSISFRPCFIPSQALENMILPRKSQLNVGVEGSIYQQGIRMTYLNPAPIAAGCYFSTDFVRPTIDIIFRAISDLIYRNYNLRIRIPNLVDISVTSRKLSCVFDKSIIDEGLKISSTWPLKSINNAVGVFEVPKIARDENDNLISPIHAFKARKQRDTKLTRLQKPDASSLKNIKERIKGLEDSSRDLFNLVPM